MLSPAVLAACSSSDSGSNASGPLKELKVGLPASISSLDVAREAGIINYTVALLAMESLMGVGTDGTLEPSLATKAAQPDAQTFVYTLREGVKFSDGSPLTIDDVIASIELNSAKGSTSSLAYAYAGVKSVKKTGANEITFSLSAPNSSFEWVPTPGTLTITSKAFLAKNGDKIGTPDVRLLGTGPYQVTEFAPDSHVTFTANPHWWGGKVEVQTVRLDFIADQSTRQLAQRNKSIDMAMQVPLDQLDQWKKIDGTDVKLATDNSLVTLAFNTKITPWNDPLVREAVARSVDRQGIVDSILKGHAEVAATIPTKEQWGGVLSKSEVNALYSKIPQFDFDLDAAKSLLAKSSAADGFSDTVTYPNSGPLIGRALLTLAENLKELGITLKVKEVTLEQWIADLGKHTAGLSIGWYFPTTGDPAEITQLLLNGAYVGENGTNIAEYVNSTVTGALDEATRTTDAAARGQLLGEALVAAAADVAYQPLWWGYAATAFGPNVTTTQYGPYFYIGPWATDIKSKG